jgi:hypothetical protein
LELAPPDLGKLRSLNPLVVPGSATPGGSVLVEAREEQGRVVQSWTVTAGTDGRFQLELDRRRLPDGRWLTLQATLAGAEREAPVESRWFIHPVLEPNAALPPVRAVGRALVLEDRPWGFAGLNYTRFLIEFSLKPNFERVAEDVRTQAGWGVSVLRVPLHLGMIQPAPGVFPDAPTYAEVLKAHRVDPRFFELLEYFVAVCGHYGIRVVFDWHEMPTDPYRHFVGGNEKDRGTDRPGRGIAWLVDPGTGRAAEPGEPRFTQALVDTNRWLARRFRGNGTVLAFEVPYNEPHSVSDSSDSAWRRLASAAAQAVHREDPERLTFGMAPAWGHNNVLPSVTWNLPDAVTGVSPHYYLGNGPVPTRPDAKQRQEPWLAREVAATFDHSFAAVAMPHSAAPYPVWNGESGEHGYSSFLPELDRAAAASLMIEAQLVQAYAAGMVGSLGWTLTGHERVYDPMRDLYRDAYRRFGPVFAAGPVDYRKSPVLFVQNPGAVPVQNGLNHACVPFARLALDLHLSPVHYMTDDQLLSDGLIQISVGLEQVEEVSASLAYRAAVVDTRNIDSRALELLEKSGIAVLRTPDPTQLTADALATFLEAAGVQSDRRTAPELQLVVGPGHLLVYRRSGDGPAVVYPRIAGAAGSGSIELLDEAGRSVFRGPPGRLAEEGLSVDLPKWRTAIYRLVRTGEAR